LSDVRVKKKLQGRARALHLDRSLFQQILQHCTEALPREACGVLGGVGNQVEHVYCLKNVASGYDRYLADPEEQLAAFRDLEDKGLELVAIFHSHPVGAAYPSDTDVSQAYYPQTLQLIIGLRNPERPVGRVFQITDGVIREVPFSIQHS